MARRALNIPFLRFPARAVAGKKHLQALRKAGRHKEADAAVQVPFLRLGACVR